MRKVTAEQKIIKYFKSRSDYNISHHRHHHHYHHAGITYRQACLNASWNCECDDVPSIFICIFLRKLFSTQ